MIKVFDFDKTLTHQDSFFLFIEFYLKKEKIYHQIIIFLFFGLLFKLRFIDNLKFKKMCINFFFMGKAKHI